MNHLSHSEEKNKMTNIKTEFLKAKRALFDRIYRKLNKDQREAIYTVNGPLLVLAGAGSGKTTVLVNRIANMVSFGNAFNDDSDMDTSDENKQFLNDYINGLTDDVERLKEIIAEVGATTPQEMGKVMGVATKKLAGLADGKAISACVKKLLG